MQGKTGTLHLNFHWYSNFYRQGKVLSEFEIAVITCISFAFKINVILKNLTNALGEGIGSTKIEVGGQKAD